MEAILEFMSVVMRVVLVGLLALTPGILFWLAVAVLVEAGRRFAGLGQRPGLSKPEGEPSA